MDVALPVHVSLSVLELLLLAQSQVVSCLSSCYGTRLSDYCFAQVKVMRCINVEHEQIAILRVS